MLSIEELGIKFNNYLDLQRLGQTPTSLYDPVDYILQLGGKRIRPVLLLAAYQLYKNDLDFAMPAAMSIEVFHNFSLVHDDIMDKADIRRGKKSTHVLFGVNSAILAGDVMLINCYKYLSAYQPGIFHVLVEFFNNAAVKICEGQQFDMEFESRDDISIPDYLKMIEYKTAILLGTALKMGGTLGKASSSDLHHLEAFGTNLGIAFQIQDDILDSFGTEENFGKKIGGDILQGKKTYLFIKTLELLSEEEHTIFLSAFNSASRSNSDKLETILRFYKSVAVKEYASQVKEAYSELALSHLDAIEVNDEKKQPFRAFASQLLNRNN